MANWHHDYYVDIVLTHVTQLTDAMKAAPVRPAVSPLPVSKLLLSCPHLLACVLTVIQSTVCGTTSPLCSLCVMLQSQCVGALLFGW